MKLLLKKCSLCASAIVHVFTSGEPNTDWAVWGSCSGAGQDQWGTLQPESSHAACPDVGTALLSEKMKVVFWHGTE